MSETSHPVESRADATRLRLLEADGVNESCLVMADVEGNEFCLD